MHPRDGALDLEAQFRSSPLPPLFLLPVVSLLLYRLGETTGGANSLNYVGFVLFMYAVAVVGWLLFRWREVVGRWFTVVAITAVAWLMADWLAIPGSLALLAVPVVLAIGLLGLRAGIGAALAATVLLIALLVNSAEPATEIAVALLAVWATFGAVVSVAGPARAAAEWSWNYFQQAQTLLEEARDRQAESKQALQDFARANQQLARLNALAQGLRQAAEDARLAKEQFVANVSHELRTPLNMILGFAQMIMNSPEAYGDHVPSALLADLAVIRRNAEHLADLIDDVLDLSQIEADQMALVKEYVSLEKILEEVTTAVRPLFESKQLYLHTDVAPHLPRIFCDHTRIREVLLNLLSNAGRFTEQGGVELRAWLGRDDVLVSVQDTGRGIAAEDMSKLFQPFQQLDGSVRRRTGGTGLGLSISKRFIDLHGGQIWATSNVGVGTTFTFRLPVGPPQPTGRDFSRWLTPNWEYLKHSGSPVAPRVEQQPRIVVLEHGHALSHLFARYLAGVEIVSVQTLEAAASEIGSAPCQAFLINEPSVSAALARAERLPLPYGVPVIACSVAGSEESAERLGATDYLVKPIAVETLLGALDRLNLAGDTVLIVDDEPEAQRLFRRMLSSSGKNYRVLRARNGQQALALLNHYRPDAILLDLVMPNMDGFQLLHALKQDASCREIPIIIISARDPLGQPIVSSALTITQEGGLSAGKLVACVKAISTILAAPNPRPDPALPAVSPG